MTLNSAEARRKRLRELLGDRFIAHRGGNTRSDCFAGELMPENSLAAFERTATRAKEKQQNVVVETDVMRCKDGFAIVHGDTGKNGKQDCWLGKITREQGYVQDYTLSELQSVRMGIRAYGEHKLDLKHAVDKTTILSLESCLQHALIKLQLGLQLEIKSVENPQNDGKDIAVLMNRLIPQDHPARAKICILSSDREVLAGFRSVAPDVPLGWLIKSVDEPYKKGNVFTDNWEKFVSHPVKPPGEYDYIHFAEADGLSPAIANVLPVPFAVGGCNDPAVAQRMLAQGALAVGADNMAVSDFINKNRSLRNGPKKNGGYKHRQD